MTGADTLQPIETSQFQPVQRPADIGPPPTLLWIDIDQLVIDPSYQRELRGDNITKVRRIAANFSWRLFATVLIAGTEDGRFAIIDGQHRVTAAALIGIKSVPAELVLADRRQQAAAFSAVNGQVTLVHPLGRFRADVAAGQADAVAITAACDAAGVRVMPYPKPQNMLEPGDTLSVSALQKVYERHGSALLATILNCITKTSNHYVGAVTGQVILGLADALKDAPAWAAAGDELFAVIDAFDLLFVARDRTLPGSGRQRVAAEVTRRCSADLGPREKRWTGAVAVAVDPVAPPPAGKPAAVKARGYPLQPANDSLASACDIALRAALDAFPGKPASGEIPRQIRIAAAVAMIEAGYPADDVRARLDVEAFALPQRENMPAQAGKCALAALEALDNLDDLAGVAPAGKARA